VLPTLFIVVFVGYLLGSLPFGWIVARAHGVNIFEVGSKSPGATNVRRNLGARAGNLVFVLDAVKGAIAAGWPLWVLRSEHQVAFCLAGLAAALLGHSFSCFTGFRGGKGVATGAGGFLILMPEVTLTAALVWVSLYFATRYVSLASIAAAVAMPLAAYYFDKPSLLTLMAAVISAFVIFRHRGNIVRLMNGTENRAGAKTEDQP
jgi:glycerol-3-phosphate acyltransferase PlsY